MRKYSLKSARGMKVAAGTLSLPRHSGSLPGPKSSGASCGFSGRCRSGVLRSKALDCSPEALVERHLGLEAHQRLGARDVEIARRLAIWHRRVPDDLAPEAAQLVDRLGAAAAARLATGSESPRLPRAAP